MTFTDQLTTIESMADAGDIPGAIARLETLKPGLQPGDASSLHVLLGALTARAGRLEESLGSLELAEALATATNRQDLLLEAAVTRASVLAAMGRYDDAIPLMARAIKQLRGHPGLSWLLTDAEAELRSYRNLVSPKTLATWASLLQ